MSIRSEKKKAFQWNSWWTRVRQVALIQVCKEFLHKRVECTFLWQLGYWSGSGRHDLLLVFVHSLSSGKVQKKNPLSCHIYTPWILQDIEDNKHFKKKLGLIIGHHLKALYYATCIQNMQFLWCYYR